VKEAEAAGADFVGVEYVAKIKEGWLDTDVIVATPDVMDSSARSAKSSAARPDAQSKAGTVTMDVAKAVKEAESRQDRVSRSTRAASCMRRSARNRLRRRSSPTICRPSWTRS